MLMLGAVRLERQCLPRQPRLHGNADVDRLAFGVRFIPGIPFAVLNYGAGVGHVT